MSDMSPPKRIYDGLSPSTLSLFMACRRKFWLKKIAHVKPDADSSDDTQALLVGKAFHKVLEVKEHNLIGMTYREMESIIKDFGLDEHEIHPMIFAMLAKYKIVHERSGLEVVGVEMIRDTPEFYGVVDVILKNPKTKEWWIGDMKTAATFYKNQVPALANHRQLNLYVAYAEDLGEYLKLDTDKFAGCRYRVTTKSKLTRKAGEDIPTFVSRLMASVKSYDYIIPQAIMNPGMSRWVHAQARSEIAEAGGKEISYPPNHDNCMQYFRPCEFWSNCHGKMYSKMMNSLEVIESD